MFDKRLSDVVLTFHTKDRFSLQRTCHFLPFLPKFLCLALREERAHGGWRGRQDS